MIMTECAEKEIDAACKRENPNWDSKSFDRSNKRIRIRN